MQANWLYVGGAVLIFLSVMMLVFAAQSMLQSRNSSSAVLWHKTPRIYLCLLLQLTFS